MLELQPRRPLPSGAAPTNAVAVREPTAAFVSVVAVAPKNVPPTVTASPSVALTAGGEPSREATTAPRPPRTAARTARRERGAEVSTDMMRSLPDHFAPSGPPTQTLITMPPNYGRTPDRECLSHLRPRRGIESPAGATRRQGEELRIGSLFGRSLRLRPRPARGASGNRFA